ncbi:MAG TPA: hypothetical protein VJ349_18065, partial [Stellaceae bacterium]|nr:hypothetical protein [Stellaceae bacterium]
IHGSTESSAALNAGRAGIVPAPAKQAPAASKARRSKSPFPAANSGASPADRFLPISLPA